MRVLRDDEAEIVRAYFGAVIAGILTLGGACFWESSSGTRVDHSMRTPSGRSSQAMLSFRGLTLNETCATVNSVLSIDELHVRDRKVGIFTIRGIEEVEMRGVHARLASCTDRHGPSEESGRSESPDFDELLALPVRDLSLGFVSRVSVRQADLVFHNGGADLLRVDAGRIDLALGSGGLQLTEGVAIHARDGSELRAARAQWQVKDGTLRVSGPHEWTDGTDWRRAASDGRFALDRSGTLRPEP